MRRSTTLAVPLTRFVVAAPSCCGGRSPLAKHEGDLSDLIERRRWLYGKSLFRLYDKEWNTGLNMWNKCCSPGLLLNSCMTLLNQNLESDQGVHRSEACPEWQRYTEWWVRVAISIQGKRRQHVQICHSHNSGSSTADASTDPLVLFLVFDKHVSH